MVGEMVGRDREVLPVVCLRWVGTLRLMFSRESRRAAWKSGWRNVQLYGTRSTIADGGIERRAEKTHVFAELIVVSICDLRDQQSVRERPRRKKRVGGTYFMKIVLVELADKASKI